MIVMVRAQPYDDTDLRAALMPPDNCASPCFIGIRPGDTSAGAALTILENHAWVRTVNIMETPISWEWSGAQPDWIESVVPGHLVTERFIVENREDGVTGVYFQTRLTLAEVYMLLGQPDQSWFRMADSRLGIQPQHTVYYERYRLQVTSPLRCPLRLAAIWRAAVVINFVNVPAQAWQPYKPANTFPDYAMGWLYEFPVC
jgi:hypothetical protein